MEKVGQFFRENWENLIQFFVEKQVTEGNLPGWLINEVTFLILLLTSLYAIYRIIKKSIQSYYSWRIKKRMYKDLSYSSFPTMSIELTHYYVKFIPNSELELEDLKSDTTLELFDYPLDYEVLEDGLYYHDPSLPDSAITYQYAVVPEDYNFPNIQNEILAELYIPELLEELNDNAVELLVDISLRLTGNEPESV